MSDEVGAVRAVWRFPVKSMLGERLGAAELTATGLVGDRAYALVDAESGKVLSGKTPRLGPLLLACRATFADLPPPGEDVPPARITLPDGTAVTTDAPGAGAALSDYLGRRVTVERSAPDDFTIDQYHPDIEGLDPQGHRDTVTESKLGAPLFAELGIPPAVPPGAFFDVFPVSVLTTSTLARLGELRPETSFDERRFRMNIVVQTTADGFVENEWPGRALRIGNDVRLGVAMPDPRCVMTTLAQDGLPKDSWVLRTLARHNRIDVGGGLFPCCGVYAVVAAGGPVREGDRVSLA